VYEVLWLRLFTSVFGATTPATAATLVAVFVGLTAGSAFFGGRSARFTRPLWAYGGLEIGAGLSALLVGVWLALYDRIYPALYGSLSGAPAGFVAVKLLLTLIALFVPTFFMGGTVPVLARAFVGERARLGVVGSGLYAANTLGAAVGALSVPFCWLPLLGAIASYAVCVGLNLLIGVLAWCVASRHSIGSAASPERTEPRERQQPIPDSCLPQRSLAALAALSGALLFILQIAWTRLFAQVHENSIYSFAVVVAVFILGLAAGAALVRAGLQRGWRARRVLGWAWIAAGCAVIASAHLFFQLTDGLSYLPQTGGWMSYGWRLAGLALATLLVPTMLSGMALPLLMELTGRAEGQPVGKALGRLLAMNTAGVVAGSLLAAFVLPSALGLWRTIAGAGIAMVIAGDLCFGELARWKPRRLAVLGCAIAVLLVWNPAVLPRTKVRASQDERLLAVQEGSHGIVAVVEQPGSRRMKLDNFYVLGGTASVGDERMQAHIPLLLHPAPKRVVFLGLGTGITAGGALLHPVEQITAVEIVPEAVTAAKVYFAEANLGFVGAPRAEMVVEDARNFLRGAGRQFDVIIGDLVVPWRRDESALYSAEHFAAVRRALAPGGLFCQWLPLFQLSEEEFRIVTATFLDVFPRATLWRGDFAPDHPALALIGHADNNAVMDPAAVGRRVREMRSDETNPHLAHEAGLWTFLVGPIQSGDPQFATAKRHRDSRPWLELLAPLAHAASTDGRRPVFVGRPLERRLGEIRAGPSAGSALAALTKEQFDWQDAGRELAEATLLFAEGRRVEGETRLRAAASRLPLEIRRAFVPDSVTDR
jgi:spermidine synthase